MDGEDKSLELDVERKEAIDKFEVMISELDEGQYEFSITTFDAKETLPSNLPSMDMYTETSMKVISLIGR